MTELVDRRYGHEDESTVLVCGFVACTLPFFAPIAPYSGVVVCAPASPQPLLFGVPVVPC